MAPCDCDQSYDVHPPSYHDSSCAIWGPRYNLPDDYEFAFTNARSTELTLPLDDKKASVLLTCVTDSYYKIAPL